MPVFVSYSSRDRDAVESLTEDLKDADEQVWLDQRLAGGEAWWRAILDQIRGCDVFVFALSQNSIQSKPCQAELHYAQNLRLPILPVQVGPVDSMQLNPLATVHTIDYRAPTPRTAMRLITALNRARSQRAPSPSPLPAEPPVPFEYLIRLFTTIAGPDQLSPRDQAALVAQLEVGLREDGDNEGARKDIVMLLEKLRDREDVTYRTRTDVDAILAALGQTISSPPNPAPSPLEAATPERASDVPGSGEKSAVDPSASGSASAARGDQRPPAQEVNGAAVGSTRPLTVTGALIVAFAILNFVIFLPWPDIPALFWRFEQLPFLSAILWLILAGAFGFAQRQLRAEPGDKLLARTSGISCIVVTVASLTELVIIVTTGNLDFRVRCYNILAAIPFSAMTAFGLVAFRLRRSWALIAAAGGSIGLSLRLLVISEIPLGDALYFTVDLAWQALLLFAGILMYRDRFDLTKQP